MKNVNLRLYRDVNAEYAVGGCVFAISGNPVISSWLKSDVIFAKLFASKNWAKFSVALCCCFGVTIFIDFNAFNFMLILHNKVGFSCICVVTKFLSFLF